MLKSLLIKNYRNLRQFELNGIGQVNLITGRNNSGKSSLLEAISIYATKGDISWLASILEERGERVRSSVNNTLPADAGLRTLSSLFPDRTTDYSLEGAIVIGPSTPSLFGVANKFDDFVALRIVRFIEEEVDSEFDDGYVRRRVVEDKENRNNKDFQVGLEIRSGDFANIYPIEGGRLYRMALRRPSLTDVQFIRTRNIDASANAALWDKIVLTNKEEMLIEALRIVEPSLDRITFINNDVARDRSIVVKLKNSNAIVPLKGMGDGINRIFAIVLALVNSDAGYLLIDEFENGLHYSVQESLWTMIFQIARDLNVQVFASTHSQDCINSFEDALHRDNSIVGKLFRLETHNREARVVDFDERELKIATDNFIETR